MTVPFVILMTGRTGSSHLVSCLDSHPRISAEGERLVGMSGVGEQLEWVERLYRRRRFRVKAVGFKTKLKDLVDRDGFASCLKRHRVTVIHMQRVDTLRQAISVLRARELKRAHGVWNRGKDTPDLAPSTIDLQALDHALVDVGRQNEELAGFVSDLDLPGLVVGYEDLLSDRDSTLGRVQDLLGVRRRSLLGTTRKTSDDRLDCTITNYDEVRKHLRGTEFEPFLS